jgi:VWFA-related protein
MKNSGKRILRGLGVLLLAAPPVIAQVEDREQEPIESGVVEYAERRLIQLDVSFTPKKKAADEPFPELSPEDFDLVINGRPIRIEYADRICHVTREETVVPVKPIEPSVPAVPAPAVPPRRPSTFIFYFEHTLLTMMGQNIALEMAERLIPELMVDGNRGMVVSSGSKVIQSEFTEDPGDLLGLIADVRKDTAQWSEYLYAQTEMQRYEEIRTQPSAELERFAARAHQLEEMRITSNRLRRLSALIGGLAEVDPPKAVFYFADMTRRNPGQHFIRLYTAGTGDPFGGYSEGTGLHHSFAFDDVLAEANAQGVRLYTIQAQGMQTIPWQSSGRPNDTSLGLTRMRDAEDTMTSFAAETGGEMFFGGVDASTMGKVLRKIKQDFSCFYLLSFYPTDLPEDSPLRVLLRLGNESEAARAADERFVFRTRGQLVVQSERKREQSLLLAAHVASATVDADPGRSAAIPLSFSKGHYEALVQFVVRGPDLPGGVVDDCVWDLGITHVFGTEVEGAVSGRVAAGDPAVPVVLETMWRFRPGRSEIVSVGHEQRLGQLATGQADLEWPDPNKSKVTISPIAVVQQVDAVFLRKSGKDEEVRQRGTLSVGEGLVDVDRPAYLIDLVCRGPRTKRDLWVQRRLAGETAADFELLEWAFDGERCIQVRDLVHGGQMSWGDFSYEVRVYDNPELEGDPLAERTRGFTALDAEDPGAAGPQGAPPDA